VDQVASASIYRGSFSATTTGTWYAVPPGYTFLFKSVAVWNPSGASAIFVLTVGNFNASLATDLVHTTVPAGQLLELSLWAVATAGDIYRVQTNGGPLGFWISGAQLNGTQAWAPVEELAAAARPVNGLGHMA